MTPDEIKHAVGERVFRSFFPKDLKNHDAEDRDNLTFVGTTEQGEEVEINKRAMESDLLVYVNINLVAMDGGHKSVPVGLASYRSVKHHHNVHTMLHSKSYMDPRSGPQRDPRLVRADGRGAEERRPQDLPDRDHAEQRDVPEALRLHEQARVGVVARRAGHVPRRQEGERDGPVAR